MANVVPGSSAANRIYKSPAKVHGAPNPIEAPKLKNVPLSVVKANRINASTLRKAPGTSMGIVSSNL